MIQCRPYQFRRGKFDVFITYSFTCGRVEAIYHIDVYLQGQDQTSQETPIQSQTAQQDMVNSFRAMVSTEAFTSTALYQIVEKSNLQITQKRLKRVLKENDGELGAFSQEDYLKGLNHEMREFKMTLKLNQLKDELNEKHKAKSGGMEITSRDIASLIKADDREIRNMLGHKKSVSDKVLLRLEQLIARY